MVGITKHMHFHRHRRTIIIYTNFTQAIGYFPRSEHFRSQLRCKSLFYYDIANPPYLRLVSTWCCCHNGGSTGLRLQCMQRTEVKHNKSETFAINTDDLFISEIQGKYLLYLV